MALLLASVILATLAPGQIPPVADLELIDQYGRADSLAAHRDHIVVAMVVTARRLRNLKGWEKQLRERYDDIHFLRIADVPEEPPVTHEQVAQKLVKRVPEEVPILIDVERRWARELELDTARPNLLLVDRDGRIVTTIRGRPEPALLDELFAAIDELTRAE
jgi:hypothetical protein